MAARGWTSHIENTTPEERAPLKAAPGLVLLYHVPLGETASTVIEHVTSFCNYSEYEIFPINTELGFPRGLALADFQGVILHYSLFGLGFVPRRGFLDSRFLDWLERQPYKVAFMQDEYRYCQSRFGFLNRYSVDCVYTLLEPEHHASTYGRYTTVPTLHTTIPGFVSDATIAAAVARRRADVDRPTDIAYRARRLPYYLGRAGQEKHRIGLEFLRRAPSEMRLDVDVEESGRLYGDDWWELLARSKGVIGVEAGGSVFDLDDTMRPAVNTHLDQHPDATFEEVADLFLNAVEDQIYYRTISPRHFEAAVFRCCQILFEGHYSGILEADVHYLSLKKDFSDFNAVIEQFRDPGVRERIRDAAFEDLIESGRYHYRSFIREFDQRLEDAGLSPSRFSGNSGRTEIARLLTRGERVRRLRARTRHAVRTTQFPGRRQFVALSRRLRLVPPSGRT